MNTKTMTTGIEPMTLPADYHPDIITRVERGGVDVEAGPMQGRLWE